MVTEVFTEFLGSHLSRMAGMLYATVIKVLRSHEFHFGVRVGVRARV
jgi:hypothetical protein